MFSFCFQTMKYVRDKTQCQLCKRLGGPIIPLSWSGMVRKRVLTMDVITMRQSTAIFLCKPALDQWWFSLLQKMWTADVSDQQARILHFLISSHWSTNNFEIVLILSVFRVAEVAQSREGPSPKSLDSDENFKPLYTLFCGDIKICRNLRTFWRSLGKKSAFLGQKQCFLGKKCTITWYILHISLS